ncbi:hypothetical protein RQP46_001196 [Phenoliferia psychrophenolica]
MPITLDLTTSSSPPAPRPAAKRPLDNPQPVVPKKARVAEQVAIAPPAPKAKKAPKPKPVKAPSRWPLIDARRPELEFKGTKIMAANCGGYYFKANGKTMEERLDKLEAWFEDDSAIEKSSSPEPFVSRAQAAPFGSQAASHNGAIHAEAKSPHNANSRGSATGGRHEPGVQGIGDLERSTAVLRGMALSCQQLVGTATAEIERLQGVIAKAKLERRQSSKKESELSEKLKKAQERLGEESALLQVARAINVDATRAHDEDRSTLLKQLQEAYTQLEIESALKAQSQQELGELRTFLSLADAGDTSRVIQSLKDVNEAVDDLAFHLLSLASSISSAGSRRITVSNTERFSFLNPLLTHIYSRRDIPRIEDFLLPVFKLLINDAVGNVLESFHPSLHPKTSAHFFRAWEGLAKTESPRGVARWRAMTYQGLQPTGDYTIRSKYSLVEVLSSFFSSLGVELSNDVFPEWTSSINAVFREAVKFHDLVRHGYTSTELAVLNPTPKVDATVRFDGYVMVDESSTKNDMTAQKKGQQPDVLGVMAFGLRQRKWREKNGESGVEDSVLLKAAVLTTKYMS